MFIVNPELFTKNFLEAIIDPTPGKVVRISKREFEALRVTKDIVSLEHPRHSDQKHITIRLIDVRAADDIRISYDFDRDGWIIEQPVDNPEQEEVTWKESAFVPAWQYGPKEAN